MGDVDALYDLALDLREGWQHGADRIWEAIEPELWRQTGNPWLVVRSASRARLLDLWERPSFRDRVTSLLTQRARELAAPTWFQGRDPGRAFGAVAYLSLEFAVSEALPLYSGGLGNVAGDYLKAANDLGLPLVGVGLLYQQGYFRQTIDAAGEQHAFYPFNDTSQLPVRPVRDQAGEWVRVRMPRGAEGVWLRAWQARVGRVVLYLLDSNDPANSPADRGITAQLYGGGAQTRLLQEIALGIGGWRVLQAAGLSPDVCHMNEGHAGLAAVERARALMQETGQPFDVALAASRAGNVFTTHTPVGAGFDRFPRDLVLAHLGTYVRDELGVGPERFLELGVEGPDDAAPFNMAWLACRTSGAVNAVSRKHARTSRRIFQPLFPRWPESEVPVGHITNGVHMPTWDSEHADALWTASCGKDRWRRATSELGESMVGCTDEDLWALRAGGRAALVGSVRERVAAQLVHAGAGERAVGAASRIFDPDVLTLGLARRFTAYKRPALLLRDPARLARIINAPDRPVQIVVAGKAHPRDEEGLDLVRRWVEFARAPEVRGRVAFLADYDLRLAEELVRGVDLWVNTPRPPWEACGTSGMKVLVNGGLNLSTLDGWWAEAYRPEGGWALMGDGRDDAADAAELYDLIERDVVPSFYTRDATGIPRAWVRKMRESLAKLAPRFAATRALEEYSELYYAPGAQAFAARRANGLAAARDLARWEEEVRAHWASLRFGAVTVTRAGANHRFEVAVYVDDLSPDAVAVELFAEGTGGAPDVRVALARGARLVGAHGYVFAGEVDAGRPATDFTPRLLPTHPLAKIPLELPLITWAG